MDFRTVHSKVSRHRIALDRDYDRTKLPRCFVAFRWGSTTSNCLALSCSPGGAHVPLLLAIRLVTNEPLNFQGKFIPPRALANPAP
jgi:hypothetical protein